MRIGRFAHLLLLLAFLASQLGAVVHATGHDLAGHGSDSCRTCAIADALPVPPSAVVLTLPPLSTHAPAALSMIGLIDRRPFARPNTRGPPAFPA